MKSEYKIFHGPVNIGGIGSYLVKYQKKRGLNSKFIVWSDFTNRQGADYNLHLEKKSFIGKVFFMVKLFFISIFKYDIFHFYFGQTLLPFGLDLPILRLLKKKVIMTYCGSDIRLAKVEKNRNPYFNYIEQFGKSDWKKIIKMKWQNLWIDKFTACRNLYDSAKEIIPLTKLYERPWINQDFICEFPSDLMGYAELKNSKPIIVHAPTNFDIKGTKYIEKAIINLKKKGYDFEYKKLYKVPNKEAHKILKNSDIIIDQLFIGGIGNLGFEALLMGKPLIVYIVKDALEKYLIDLPFINATIDNIEEKIAYLLNTPKKRVKLGKRGPKWVKKNFDCNKAMEWVIRELYEL